MQALKEEVFREVRVIQNLTGKEIKSTSFMFFTNFALKFLEILEFYVENHFGSKPDVSASF